MSNIADPESTSSEWFSYYFPPVREPNIVIIWLMRLRWLAIVGQVLATVFALMLGLNVQSWPVAIVVGVTLMSNIALWQWSNARSVPTWPILGILLMDITLLTILLIYTGGPENPFSTLYLVHVAMAVTTLGAMWTWIVVGGASIAYAMLFVIQPVPLAPEGLPERIHHLGLLANFVLVGSLIAYFVGRVNRSLRRRELQISSLRERNARHEKLSTIATLAAGAAHELGTPLSTIALVAKELELAIARLPDTSELVEDAQLIRAECNRCRFIIDRMRVEVVSDPSTVATPLDELMKLLAMHLRDDERERLTIVGPQEGLSIAAPCAAIEQSLTVMIRNGFDASPPESRMKMVIRRLKTSIAFEVIDQGHGMPPEVAKRAGDPFFTTKQPGRGMGLGLFLVRLVAENFRGDFRIDSNPGAGTKVTLELPLA